LMYMNSPQFYLLFKSILDKSSHIQILFIMSP